MFEHFTGEGRQVVERAQEQARRLGHGFIGTEHLLYGLASADGQVGEVLRERGVTPERYEAQFVELVGPGPHPAGRGGRPDPAADPLDRDALSAIGIDLDAVRARVEALFGPGALLAGAAEQHRWGRGRRRPASGHLPVTRRARKCLAISLHAARAAQAGQAQADQPGAKHIALALLAMDEGLPPRILSAIGARAPELRTEILDRYRQAD
jgi:ATP-dependent Clp protease ATP-binding subunit ClpA